MGPVHHSLRLHSRTCQLCCPGQHCCLLCCCSPCHLHQRCSPLRCRPCYLHQCCPPLCCRPCHLHQRCALCCRPCHLHQHHGLRRQARHDLQRLQYRCRRTPRRCRYPLRIHSLLQCRTLLQQRGRPGRMLSSSPSQRTVTNTSYQLGGSQLLFVPQGGLRSLKYLF